MLRATTARTTRSAVRVVRAGVTIACARLRRCCRRARRALAWVRSSWNRLNDVAARDTRKNRARGIPGRFTVVGIDAGSRAQAPLRASAITARDGRGIRATACAARVWLRKFLEPSFDVGPNARHRDTPRPAHDETLQLAGIHEPI